MENFDPDNFENIRGRGRPLGARTIVKSVNLKRVAEIDQKKTNHLQCNVCNMSFATLVKFAIHCLKNHFNSIFYQYDCGFCYEVHSSRDSFLDHVISQAAEKDSSCVAIVCPLCVLPQGPSCTEEQFCQHLRQQHVDPRLAEWVCQLPSCEYVAYECGAYAKHIIAAHTNQTVANAVCRLCRSPRTSSGYLRGPTVKAEQLHSYVEEVDGAVETCPLCDEVLKDCNTLLVSDKDEVISFEKPKYYRCSICNSGFSTQTKVTKHACRLLHTTHCERCNIRFTSKKRLVFHLQSHVDPSMTLRCDVCMLTFTDETTCYDHVRFSHESETLCCDTCGKTYITRIGLSMHQMYHDDVRKFKCGECGKRFLNQATLKEHRVSHLNVKPFQCDICGKSLSRASRLRIHLKVHSARSSTNFQKCFTCKLCGFVSFSGERLTEHNVKVHNDSVGDVKTSILHKLYRCEYCDSCYEMPSLLHAHRETHAPDVTENPFVCGLCNGFFKTYSRLVTHKLSHGINTESHILQISASLESSDSFIIPQYFCCKYCDKLYEQYTAYNIHMKHSKHFVPKERPRPPPLRERNVNTVRAPSARRQPKQPAAATAAKVVAVKTPLAKTTTTRSSGGRRNAMKRELDLAIENVTQELLGISQQQQQQLELPSLVLQQRQQYQLMDGASDDLLQPFSPPPRSPAASLSLLAVPPPSPSPLPPLPAPAPHTLAPNEKLICCKCGKNFATEKMLRVHENRHNPRRKRKAFPCDECERFFSSKTELKKHENVYHRPYLACEHCGKEFRYRGWYLQHMQNRVCAKPEEETDDEEMEMEMEMEMAEADEEEEDEDEEEEEEEEERPERGVEEDDEEEELRLRENIFNEPQPEMETPSLGMVDEHGHDHDHDHDHDLHHHHHHHHHHEEEESLLDDNNDFISSSYSDILNRILLF